MSPSLEVRLDAAWEGDCTPRDSIFIDANAFESENEGKEKEPSALHTVSL